jgi:hypothetical protein
VYFCRRRIFMDHILSLIAECLGPLLAYNIHSQYHNNDFTKYSASEMMRHVSCANSFQPKYRSNKQNTKRTGNSSVTASFISVLASPARGTLSKNIRVHIQSSSSSSACFPSAFAPSSSSSTPAVLLPTQS